MTRRVLVRLRVALRRQVPTLLVVGLLAAGGVLGYAFTRRAEAADCADVMVRYLQHPATYRAAYACLADPPEFATFRDHSMHAGLMATISRAADIRGGRTRYVVYLVTTGRGDELVTVNLDQNGKVLSLS